MSARHRKANKQYIKESGVISDHAILRYLQRMKGIDVTKIRQHLLDSGVDKAIKLGATSVVVDGVKFILSGGRVVTVYGD